tara:strand:+ start:191 stop:1090 length:900 start_codon:yes stop_codon:yes gene_type:complete
LSLKNNILIVGGTGFIGYHLAKKSLKKGWKVTSISSKRPRKKRYLPQVKYIICDITKKKSLRKNIQKSFNYVVNLGGYVDHSNRKKTFKSHYIGCKNLAEIFLKKELISFVQMGSSAEYGNVKSPQKENAKCKPKSVYGQAKLLSSTYLIDLFKKQKFPSTILRLYNTYGSRQDLNRFIPIVISGCTKNKKFPCSIGNQVRDFLHIDDVVDAIIKSLTNKNARGQIINIGSGKPRIIKNIIEYIKKISKGGYPLFGKVKLRRDEILTVYPDINKARNKIGWRPKISFKKGLKVTIDSFK